MVFDIKLEFKKLVLNTSSLSKTYSVSHPNSKYSLDLIIDEIFYVLKSGVSWRNLRSPINCKSLFWHFNRFSKAKIFHRLFRKLKTLYLKSFNCSTFLIDSTPIFNKFGVNKIGRNKFYKNKRITKISLLSDINGFPLSVFFMKGNKHDITVFTKHVDDLVIVLPKRKLKILADKGYSSKNNYEYLENNNISHIIPPRKNMKLYDSYSYNLSEYKKRIKIEHIFARFKLFNRVQLRFDKMLRNFSSFTFLAFSIIGINILQNYNK